MENSKLNVRSLGAKFQSKNEIYRFLTTEVDMHLPPQKECSIYFVRDILSSSKKALYNDQVKVKVVPQIDNLRVKNFIWFLQIKCENALDYLPDDYENKNICRQWLCNLCNTLNQKEFELFVANAIKERQTKFIEKYNMEIDADPRIVRAFEMSYFVSTTKGRSHLLIRKPKELNRNLNIREERKEIEIVEEEKDSQISKLQNEICKLKNELETNREIIDKNDKYADLLNDLFHKGIIDEEGNFLDDNEQINSRLN